MSIAYQIVVCAGIVPDPLQTLEPVALPAGPALKNEMMLARCPRSASERLPLLSRDPGLTQHFGQQVWPDVASVRIRNGHGYASPLHEFVSSASVRPAVTQPPEAGGQLPPFDGAESRHQAKAGDSLTVRSNPSTTGMGSCREIRNSSQSSSVPASSPRQASNVSACARTP